MPEDREKARQLEALRLRQAEEATDREIAALVDQIKEARQGVETALTRLTNLSEDLRLRTRRAIGEKVAPYTVFAQAHLRFSGAATQGMKRTASMDRLLDKAQAEKEEARRREAQEVEWKARQKVKEAAKQKVNRLILPPSDDDAFDELYGEVNNA